MNLFIIGFGVWFLLVICAVLNGLLRQYIIQPKLGELRAHQISCFTFIALMFIVTVVFLRIGNFDNTTTQLLTLGVLWLCMTLAFEFLFFHYVVGHPWSKLLADYNIRKGRLWVLVLIATLFMPLLASLFISSFVS